MFVIKFASLFHRCILLFPVILLYTIWSLHTICYTTLQEPLFLGKAYLCRYADDFVCAFQDQIDAERFLPGTGEKDGKIRAGTSDGKDEDYPVWAVYGTKGKQL
jgi:hypothetical protein